MLYSRWHTILWFAYIIWIIWSSLTPMHLPMEIGRHDKLLHLAAYFLLAFFYPWRHVYHNRAIVFMLLVAIGIVLEILQATLPVNRTGDPFETLINTLGVFLGIVFINLFGKSKPHRQQ
ncbi:VanZ family protein [Desulfovulcanus sp.]